MSVSVRGLRMDEATKITLGAFARTPLVSALKYPARMTELLACERVWLGCRNTSTQKLFAHTPTVFAVALLLDLNTAGVVAFHDLQEETQARISVTGRSVGDPLLAHTLQMMHQAFDDGTACTRVIWALNAITPHAMGDAIPYLEERGVAIREKHALGRTRWQPNPRQRLSVLQEARDDVLRGDFRTEAGRNFLIAVSAGNYESLVLGQDGLTDSHLTERLASMLSDDALAVAFESIVALTTHVRLTVQSH